LPPYVIFEWKIMAKVQFPQGIIVKLEENGWMTEDLAEASAKSVGFQ
jgi:hypothetical protein